MSLRDENFDIYVLNADGTNPVNLTNHPSGDEGPSWSPNEAKIVFDSRRESNANLVARQQTDCFFIRLQHLYDERRW